MKPYPDKPWMYGYNGACVRHACADEAVKALQTAVRALRRAGSPKALARARLALSSAKGALRNADCRVTREHARIKQIKEAR